MDRRRAAAYTGGMNSIGTRLFTWMHGRNVGQDGTGTPTWPHGAPGAARRDRRWVLYAGLPEASDIPPEWHAWLHHTTDVPLPELGRKPWQLPHRPNATGTVASYRPAGHDYSGGRRAAATGDYEAWTPGS